MHVYLNSATQLPIYNSDGKPLLRPLSSNYELPIGWGKWLCTNLERSLRIMFKFGYSMQETFHRTKQQADAAQKLTDGTYMDGDFKHATYQAALSSTNDNKLALLFGLPSKEQVQKYLEENLVLVNDAFTAECKRVMNEANNAEVFKRHTVKLEEFETLLSENAMSQLRSKKAMASSSASSGAPRENPSTGSIPTADLTAPYPSIFAFRRDAHASSGSQVVVDPDDAAFVLPEGSEAVVDEAEDAALLQDPSQLQRRQRTYSSAEKP